MRRESSKNQFGRPKKKVDKIFENPPPPPLEKILDPPQLYIIAELFLENCLSVEKTRPDFFQHTQKMKQKCSKKALEKIFLYFFFCIVCLTFDFFPASLWSQFSGLLAQQADLIIIIIIN